MKNNIVIARSLRSIVHVANSILNLLEEEMDPEATASPKTSGADKNLLFDKDFTEKIRKIRPGWLNKNSQSDEAIRHQKRSEAAKKAWVTIRANKAKAAKKNAKSK